MSKWKRRSNGKERGLMITRLLARDGSSCYLCGCPLDRTEGPESPLYITFDHVTPRAHGGSDRADNLKLAHAVCNWARGTDPVTLVEEGAQA